MDENEVLLRYRLTELRNWFSGVLQVCEQRDAHSIGDAVEAYTAWACKGRENDVIGALVVAWDSQERMREQWENDPAALAEAFPITPPQRWEVHEWSLVAGLVFVTTANGLKTQAATAMLYADAVGAQDGWMANRGYARCRNPNTLPGEHQKALEDLDAAMVRKATGASGAIARWEKDTERKEAKAGAHNWWKENRHQCTKGKAVEEVARIGGKDERTAQRWIAAWKQEAGG